MTMTRSQRSALGLGRNALTVPSRRMGLVSLLLITASTFDACWLTEAFTAQETLSPSRRCGGGACAPKTKRHSPLPARRHPTATWAVNGSDGISSLKVIENGSHKTSPTRLVQVEPVPTDRRKVLASVSAAAATAFFGSSLAANAYGKEGFPIELNAVDEEVDGRQRKVDLVNESEYLLLSPLSIGPFTRPLGAFLWGSAIWFLSGSRNTPIATPLANVVYDEKEASWLKDRNAGLFADFPLPFYLLLVAVFAAVGFGTDSFITALGEGDRNISLQLAGVSLITGGSLELGRIANGEKTVTRKESDRSEQLEAEFIEFADSRLMLKGNCHRVDVIRAFRRYYAKYRQPDDPNYPLADLEIEQLLKSWSKPLRKVEMSSAGFYSGLQVNEQADAFASR